MACDQAKLEQAGRLLLEAIGENPDRDGLVETPARWARWWRDFIDGDHGTPTTFTQPADDDQLVVVSDMRVWSLCEHHLLPFWCDMAVGYVPRGRILGLSKFARLARRCAAKLQVQERLVRDVAAAVQEATGSADVAVLARGEHLCMTLRGVRTPALMTSSCLGGRFYDGPLRAEFLALAAGRVRS